MFVVYESLPPGSPSSRWTGDFWSKIVLLITRRQIFFGTVSMFISMFRIFSSSFKLASYACFCLFLSVIDRFCPFLSVSVGFCQFLSVSVCFYLLLSASVHCAPFLFVSVIFGQFMSVDIRLCPFLSLLGFLGLGASICTHQEIQCFQHKENFEKFPIKCVLW